MPVSFLSKNLDIGVLALVSILEIFQESELQKKPYLVKNGVEIIL